MKAKFQKNMLGAGALLFLLSCLSLMSFTPVSEADGIPVVYHTAIEKPSIAPVNLAKARIGDRFGFRIHPVTKKNKMHNGIDFILPEGEQVFATAGGVVTEVGTDKDKGTFVTIKHNDIYTTGYSHLKSAAVKTGDVVKKKQLVGYVGSTGATSAEPHLHYEVLKEEKHVDPVEYLPKLTAAKP